MAKPKKCQIPAGILDETTGTYTAAYLQKRTEEELKRAERYHEPLAFILLDVRGQAESRGSATAQSNDPLLKEVGRRIGTTLREIDILGRHGRDALGVLLPSTPFSGALAVAKRILSKIDSAPLSRGRGAVNATLHAGIALYPSRDVHNREELVEGAEQALSRARREGPGRICLIHYAVYVYGESLPR